MEIVLGLITFKQTCVFDVSIKLNSFAISLKLD